MSDTIARFIGGGRARTSIYVRLSDVSAFEQLPFTEGDDGERRVVLHMKGKYDIHVRAHVEEVRQLLCSRSGVSFMDMTDPDEDEDK